MTLQELLDIIKQLDEQALELRKQMSIYTFKKLDLEQKIKDYETDIKYKVLIENDIGDLKLTNQEQRKVYIEKLLKEDAVYRSLVNELKQLERELDAIRFELSELDIQYAHYVNMLNFGLYEYNGEEGEFEDGSY